MSDTARNPTSVQIPDWLDEHLASAHGPFTAQALQSRRGVTTLTVRSRFRQRLVKLAEDTADGEKANRDAVRREASVLSAVQPLQEQFFPVLVSHDDDVALAENWIDGEPAFRNLRTLVDAGKEFAVLEVMRRTIRALELVHNHGWAHGDLQPAHFLLNDHKATLLDFGVAQSEILPLANYRGGMVHFNAPEVAASILATGRAIATPASDMFSLGATFAWAITGRVIGDYGKPVSWEDKLAALAKGRLRTDLVRAALGSMPGLLGILLDLLNTDPATRPHNASVALRLLPTS